MNLYVFCNSTGYEVYDGFGKPNLKAPSYLDSLRKEYGEVQGCWLNGLMILHVREMVRRKVSGDRNGQETIVILNVGVCESATRSVENFLNLTCHYLNAYGYDKWFGAYVVPVMDEVSRCLVRGEKKFVQFLHVSHFLELFSQVFFILQGVKIICLGLNKPNLTSEPWRHEQVKLYNDSLANLCSENRIQFLDVWNLCEEEIVDNTHMTARGHSLIFEELKRLIG